MKNLVTGATGFVGSHIVEKLLEDGPEVVAMARKTSDTSFLKKLGVEIRYGSVTEISKAYDATIGIDRVFHAAAVTDEWLPKTLSYKVNVCGTTNMLEASYENKVKRFFFISSLSVMGLKNHYNTDEYTDYHKCGDPYIDTKIEAEKNVWKFSEFGMPITVLRPGFMYGPRDRRFMKRILEKLRTNGFIFIGSGENKLNLNYAGNLADAVVLASKTDDSIGQVYNIANDDASLDMKTFIYKVADLWGYDRPQKHMPVPVAKIGTSLMESSARLMNKKEPPLLTKTRLKFLSLNLQFDITKAKQQLGFQNNVDIDKGLTITKEWIGKNGPYEC